MFDNGEFKFYLDNLKRQMREDLLDLIDHALEKHEFEWCAELHKRLQWVL